VVEDLAEVERFLDKANTHQVAGLAGGLKAELLATVSRVRNKLDALEATVLSGFEATAEHRAEGHSTPIGWLKHHAHVRGPDAARRRRVARALRSMPLAHDAMRAGRITGEHVEALDRVRRLVGDEAFDLGEEVLVDYAISERFGDFARTLDYFVERAAPVSSTERRDREVEERWASSEASLGGCGSVGAWMDRETFAVWQPELDRLSEFLHRSTSPRPTTGSAVGLCPPSSTGPTGSAAWTPCG
jgi:hypothetical protein